MKALVSAARLKGQIDIPASKSEAHRALIAAALSDGEVAISGLTTSDDIEKTAGALVALGAEIRRFGALTVVTGIKQAPAKAVIDCGESGSTLRFMLPIAAVLGVEAAFILHGRLAERPLDDMTALLESGGVTCSRSDGGARVHISGRFGLKAARIRVCDRADVRLCGRGRRANTSDDRAAVGGLRPNDGRYARPLRRYGQP